MVMFPLAVEELAELLDSDFDTTDREVLGVYPGIGTRYQFPSLIAVAVVDCAIFP